MNKEKLIDLCVFFAENGDCLASGTAVVDRGFFKSTVSYVRDPKTKKVHYAFIETNNVSSIQLRGIKQALNAMWKTYCT